MFPDRPAAASSESTAAVLPDFSLTFQQLARFHALDGFVEQQADAHLGHAGGQGLRYLGVQELQQPVAAFHQRDLDAQRLKQARVFAADDAAAGDQHGAGNVADSEDGVGVVHARVFERKIAGAVRPRSGRDQEHIRGQRHGRSAVGRDGDRVRIGEGRESLVLIHFVAFQVGLDAGALGSGDVLLMKEKIARGDLVGHVERHAVQPALPETGKVQRRLAKSLGWQSSGVGRGPAQSGRLFHQRDFLAEVRGLRRALFAGRSGADHHQVIFVGHVEIQNRSVF